MTRKFYRTIVHFEVLSEDAPVGDDVSLETIAAECDTGNWSGRFLDNTEEELTAPEMARALIEQGSDPEFFQLEEEVEE